MKGWLLDTNVLSELRRGKPVPSVVEFVASKPIEALFVSEVSLAEIRFGIERAKEPGLRAELKIWLDRKVRPMFERRTLPVSEDVMFQWRLLVEEGRRMRHTLSQPDLIVAATALHYDLTLVTRDTADFEKTRVALTDPWRLPQT
jgi:predicted nucleic acid-binding protein